MPSAEPSRLTDDLWLAAHDSVDGKPCIGEWPLGVGLATGLLAELVHDRFLELRRGELFRATAVLPDDPALRPLLATMAGEERDWPSPTSAVRATAQEGWDPPARAGGGQGWPAPTAERRSWHPAAREDWSRLPMPEENRHRMRGHKLGDWTSYLAYEKRAEKRVIDRLARAGLVRREEHRRVLGRTSVRYVPYDSAVAVSPATVITTAVQRGYGLPWSGLFLAGLFLRTGLHQHALATLTRNQRSALSDRVGRGLDETSRELLQAADTAVGEAAMR